MAHVIVVGGGASGALAAAQLLLRGADITVPEPATELGRGMAYSTRCPLHLLNVRACHMSAFPDDSTHFLRWLDCNGPGQYITCSFVPRSLYGNYIRSVRDEALQAGRGKFRHLSTRAIGARFLQPHAEIETETSEVLRGDALIRATGNAAPAPWPGLSPEIASSGRFFNLAWMKGAFEMRDRHAPVAVRKRTDCGGCPARAAAQRALRQGVHGGAAGPSAANARAAGLWLRAPGPVRRPGWSAALYAGGSFASRRPTGWLA